MTCLRLLMPGPSRNRFFPPSGSRAVANGFSRSPADIPAKIFQVPDHETAAPTARKET